MFLQWRSFKPLPLFQTQDNIDYPHDNVTWRTVRGPGTSGCVERNIQDNFLLIPGNDANQAVPFIVVRCSNAAKRLPSSCFAEKISITNQQSYPRITLTSVRLEETMESECSPGLERGASDTVGNPAQTRRQDQTDHTRLEMDETAARQKPGESRQTADPAPPNRYPDRA